MKHHRSTVLSYSSSKGRFSLASLFPLFINLETQAPFLLYSHQSQSPVIIFIQPGERDRQLEELQSLLKISDLRVVGIVYTHVPLTRFSPTIKASPKNDLGTMI